MYSNVIMAAEEVRKISLTGSTRVGKLLMAEAAKTGPQERLASLHHEFEFLTGLPPLESEESPEEVSFLNLLLVRTNVLRPVLEHSHALMTDWLPEPRRAEFLLSSLGTLCHRQGFLVRKHNDHDASK